MIALTFPPPTSTVEIARALVAELEPLTDELVGIIRAGEHAYAESTLLTADQLRSAVHDNLDSVLRQLSGETDVDLAAAGCRAAAGVMRDALIAKAKRDAAARGE